MTSMLEQPVFKSIAVIGIGLIGSSIAHAARAYGAAGRVCLYDMNADVRMQADRLGLGPGCLMRLNMDKRMGLDRPPYPQKN